jgi:hypothetical protein
MNALLTAAEVSRRLSLQLSLPARLGYVILLLVSLAVAGVVSALLLTEPALPLRTQCAFGVIVAIGLAWAGYAAWVLRHRQVLFARHRVIAGRMAVSFAAIFLLGALLLGRAEGFGASWYGALAVGLVMLCAAAIVLYRANRRLGELLRRRHELECELAGHEATP